MTSFNGCGAVVVILCCDDYCRLTYNYGREDYDIGTGFGHFGLAVHDVYKTVDEVKGKGGVVSRDAGPVKGGKTNIAFVKDPTGYSWELIERKGEITEPIAQVMLRVGDLDRSIKFYTEALGMKLLRTRDNPEYKYTLAFLGYGDEQNNTVFELTYNYGKDSSNYTKGDAYAQVAISTKDVFKTAEQIKAAGGTITRDPGPVPGIGTKIGTCKGDIGGVKCVTVASFCSFFAVGKGSHLFEKAWVTDAILCVLQLLVPIQMVGKLYLWTKRTLKRSSSSRNRYL